MTTTSIFWDKKVLRVAGGGLVVELPYMTSDRMEQLFGKGAGMKMQRKEKYSRSIIIRLKPSNQMYALYMCFGVWRIGASGTVMTRIGDLLTHLNPEKYKGLEMLRDDIVIRAAQLIADGRTVGEAIDEINEVNA